MDIQDELKELEKLGFDICTAEAISCGYDIDEHNQLITDLVSIEMYYPEDNERKFICYYSLEEIKTTLEVLKS